MEYTEMTEQVKKKRSKAPLIVSAALLTALAGGYIGLCAYARASGDIWKGTQLLGQDVGGLTVSEATQKLDAALPSLKVGLYLYDGLEETPEQRAQTPDAEVSLSDLGLTVDTAALAQDALRRNTEGSLLTIGWHFLSHSGAVYGGSAADFHSDAEQTAAAAQAAASSLSWDTENTSYEMGEQSVLVHMAKDGRTVDAAALTAALSEPASGWSGDLSLDVPYSTQTAQTMTAQEIYDTVSGEMKNAGYDRETGSITTEQTGAEFDVAAAQAVMDTATPGSTVEIAAQIEYPAVTAEQLKPVLFRDELGSYTTHVGGSAARISNVKLASAAVDGTVLNCGDLFDYNQVVGQRTAARGYQAAPAYVQGETVDEIGGGVCQPSSTLYLATLKSNLEIVERYAHRYVPSYIPKGMDATVSWGGPNYQFRNNTDYPIKIRAVYSKGYLTMTLYGTKTDGVTVKMTNKVLSTTEYETVYEDDPTLPAGTESVKTTPYTGYKVETYRNLYDRDGNLISSNFEASSNYKVRNKVILKGPAATTDTPAGGASSSVTVPETPVTPETPVVTPEAPVITPETPVVPEETVTPPASEPETPAADPPSTVISPLPAA